MWKNIKSTIIFTIIYLVFYINYFVLCESKREGDSCLTARVGGPGICKRIAQCPKAISDIKNRRGYPSVCGHENYVQIICCPDDHQQPDKPVIYHGTSNSRISELKCKEYSKLTYKELTSYNFVTGQSTTKIVKDCPFESVPLIVGGKPAQLKEFPHMAAIGYDNGVSIEWKCGGTLISDYFVLTAAHCLNNPRVVRLGELIFNNDADHAQPIDLPIARIIPHPEYSLKSIYNDIGLIKVVSRVRFNSFIRPACLPHAFETGTKRAIATGWGRINENRDIESDKLLKVTLDLYSVDECRMDFMYLINDALKDGINEKTQFCAGSYEGQKDTCYGDSGGPLQIYDHAESCMYNVVGITSFGIGCGDKYVPGVYTRVHSYLKWIEDTVWPNE